MGFSYISDSGRKRLPQYAYKGKDPALKTNAEDKSL